MTIPSFIFFPAWSSEIVVGARQDILALQDIGEILSCTWGWILFS